MELQSTVGGWIPLWILGAPLLAALIEWMRTPKTSTRQEGDSYPSYAQSGRAPQRTSTAQEYA